MSEQQETFEGWAILELMGHRRLAGRVSQAELAGAAFIRIDIPSGDGDIATQFYAPAALYCLTPTTEAIARQVAMNYQPEPVTRWELRAIEASSSSRSIDDDDEEAPF